MLRSVSLSLALVALVPQPAYAAEKRQPHLCDTPYEGRVFTLYPCSFYDTHPAKRREFVPGVEEKPQPHTPARDYTRTAPKRLLGISQTDFTRYFDTANEFKKQARRCSNYAFHHRGDRAECKRVSGIADDLTIPVGEAKALLKTPEAAESVEQLNHAYMLVNTYDDGRKLWREALDRLRER
ncbi:hypothetical protein ACQUQP_19880 [Marinobacterium sp. YM272]|uniref:hypothetical protein n=1 Tax=Marinobacterium sp. YM272 TaxID=3421654 RepID=UPI003D7FB6F6